MQNFFPQKQDLGICPLCKGAGTRKDSDFTRLECICEETGNKYFTYIPNPNKVNLAGGVDWFIVDYQDKTLLDKISKYFEYGRVTYQNGHQHNIFINSLARIEPFYTLKDYNLNHYDFPPIEDPLFPFHRTKPINYIGY